MRGIAVLSCFWKAVCNPCPQCVAQLRFAFLFRLPITYRPFRSRDHSCNRSDVFRSGASLVFVRTAEHDWMDRQATSQKKKSSALWPVEFVRRKTGRINEPKIDVGFTERLHHVAVQENSVFTAYLRNFAHGLNCARLVVGGHDGNQSRFGAN